MNHRRLAIRPALAWGLAVSFAILLQAPARAQDLASTPSTETQTSPDSKPLRAARLSFLQGAVTVRNSADSATQPARTNMPIFAGVQIATGSDGQAEIEFEDGSLIRLTPNSTLALDRLTTAQESGDAVATTALDLLTGLVYAELRAVPDSQYTLRAGQDVLTPVENVTVRVSFDQPPAAFAVLSGSAAVADQNGEGRREISAGDTLTADPREPGEYTVSTTVAQDSWDAWNADLDQAEAAQTVDRTDVRNGYAGPQGYGWSDLDADGTWYDVPGQDQVWQPTIAAETAGWDPYGFGAWVWYPATGYVWSSGYNWGWTPYRCGAWSFYGGFGWGWSPAGCGAGLGWAFWGAGRPVNILHGPGGYRVPHVPGRPPGPVHPILPGRHEPPREPGLALAGATGWGTALERMPRQINGTVAIPVAHGRQAILNGSLPHRSGLDRDFPVDGNSHLALTGRVPSRPGVVQTQADWRSTSAPESYTGQSGAAIFRHPPTAASTPAGQSGPRSSYAPSQEPALATGPRPAYTPGQVHPAYAPGEVARPSFPGTRPLDRPGFQRPAYAQPDRTQPPRYNPPPAQRYIPQYAPPMPRYSPPPAPPAPHAAPSASAPRGH